MVTKEQALAAIDRVRRLVKERQQGDPSDVRYPILLKEFDRVERLIEMGWPLAAKDAADLRFGLFGVKEVEDDPKLSDQLNSLDRLLKGRI